MIDEDMAYDEWRDNQVADELKGLPNGAYQKRNGKMVEISKPIKGKKTGVMQAFEECFKDFPILLKK